MRRNLDDELKLLQWHKVANESALRAALIRTKCSRENDKRLSIELEMKARKKIKERMMRVEDEEKSKPLEVRELKKIIIMNEITSFYNLRILFSSPKLTNYLCWY